MKIHGSIVSGVLLTILILTVGVLLPSSSVAQSDTPAPAIVQDIIEQVGDPDISQADLQVLLVPLTVDELAELTSRWQGILRAKLSEIARLNLAIASAGEAEIETLRKTLEAETVARTDLVSKYAAVQGAWERKGAVPEDLAKHRSYLASVTSASVLTTDPVTLLRNLGKWLLSRDGGLGVLLKLGGMVLAVWAMFIVAAFAKRAARRGLEKIPNMSRLLMSFVLVLVYWLTFFIGVMSVLALFGVNITPLFAIFGGASFILGFALQEVLGNLASGLMLMVLKPFDMGDFIHAAGTSGVVDEMSVVSTQIRTFDNQIITVPNSKIWGDVITNVNASHTRRVDLVFGIAYSDNAAEAIKVLEQLIEADPRCLADPEPAIFVGELGDSSVNIFCRPWVNTIDYWDVYWGLTGQAKERFDEAGISIPFPQRDVHVVSSPDATP